MTPRLNYLQKLYGSTAKYGEPPYDDSSIDLEDAFNCFGGNPEKLRRAIRRDTSELAKTRLFETAVIAKKSSRARLSHADRYPKSVVPEYQTAKRLIAAAQKMGMDI